MLANRKIHGLLLALATGAMLWPNLASAADKPKTSERELKAAVVQLFAALDKNKDNFISKPEAKKNKDLETAFVLIDTNLDDKLSGEEVLNYLKVKLKAEK